MKLSILVISLYIIATLLLIKEVRKFYIVYVFFCLLFGTQDYIGLLHRVQQKNEFSALSHKVLFLSQVLLKISDINWLLVPICGDNEGDL